MRVDYRSRDARDATEATADSVSNPLRLDLTSIGAWVSENGHLRVNGLRVTRIAEESLLATLAERAAERRKSGAR